LLSAILWYVMHYITIISGS